MKKKDPQQKTSLDTKELQSILVSHYINQCIRCNHCMDVCPVTKPVFTIDELNNASTQGTTVPETIKKFAFNCVQCGKCVPVCPMNIHRDYMVRYIKHKLRDQKPRSYKQYLLIKGPYKTGAPRLLQRLFVGLRKIMTHDLSVFMETTPVKNAEVLFYPGCYIYSTKTVRQTLRLLNHIGCSYTILGGVTTCCGAPHLLQGEFDQADRCQELLHQKIKAVNPKLVITACAECFEAVEHIKTLNNQDYEVLSVIQYLCRNINKFPDIKIRGDIMVHDSCRFTKESLQGTAARDAVERFGELKEQPLKQETICCYQWNHKTDPQNNSRQKNYLSSVKKTAPTLACNCLTCYEELKKIQTDVEIIDILQLFEEAITIAQTKERASQ